MKVYNQPAGSSTKPTWPTNLLHDFKTLDIFLSDSVSVESVEELKVPAHIATVIDWLKNNSLGENFNEKFKLTSPYRLKEFQESDQNIYDYLASFPAFKSEEGYCFVSIFVVY